MTSTHKFHLVTSSPWPLLTGISVLNVVISGAYYLQLRPYGLLCVLTSIIILLFFLINWWRDIIIEGQFLGYHTIRVNPGLRIGMVLFIVSEIMFFVGFFWAFFHSALTPIIEIGCIWPPLGITPFFPLSVPFLNTIILLTSGATITLAHSSLLAHNRLLTIEAYVATIYLAILFTFLQGLEYYDSLFNINDSIYGSTFYILTGFHGLHVIIGTIFIVVSFLRYLVHEFTIDHHFCFEASSWYWHFVDVVWLLLFVLIYVWGYYN